MLRLSYIRDKNPIAGNEPTLNRRVAFWDDINPLMLFVVVKPDSDDAAIRSIAVGKGEDSVTKQPQTEKVGIPAKVIRIPG
jgi:hypothetical protein